MSDLPVRLAALPVPWALSALVRTGRWAVNRCGDLWTALGGRLPGFDGEALLREAARETQLSRPAPLPAAEGLEIFCESLEQDAALGLFGRLVLRGMVVRSLANQLRHLHLSRAGHVPARPLRPVFVLGLPRSGTTYLHRLLCALPETWGIPIWEATQPVLQRRPDRRRLLSALELLGLRMLVPELDRKHAFELDSPEEAITLFDAAGGWNPAWWRYARVSRYLGWLLQQDPLPGYRAFGELVQWLGRDRPGRPVLKTPNHLGALEALHVVFPDAVFVQTHRDPAACLPSYMSLQASMYGSLSESVDRHAIGRSSLHLWATHARRGLEARRRRPELPVLDVAYEDLLADPKGVVVEVSAHAGLPLGPAELGRIDAELARRTQHRHGRHHYDLADYGLTEAQVHAAFPDYLAAHLPEVRSGEDEPCASD